MDRFVFSLIVISIIGLILGTILLIGQGIAILMVFWIVAIIEILLLSAILELFDKVKSLETAYISLKQSMQKKDSYSSFFKQNKKGKINRQIKTGENNVSKNYAVGEKVKDVKGSEIYTISEKVSNDRYIFKDSLY